MIAGGGWPLTLATGGGEEVGLRDGEEGGARTRGGEEVGLRDGKEGGARTRGGEEVGAT